MWGCRVAVAFREYAGLIDIPFVFFFASLGAGRKHVGSCFRKCRDIRFPEVMEMPANSAPLIDGGFWFNNTCKSRQLFDFNICCNISPRQSHTPFYFKTLSNTHNKNKSASTQHLYTYECPMTPLCHHSVLTRMLPNLQSQIKWLLIRITLHPYLIPMKP